MLWGAVLAVYMCSGTLTGLELKLLLCVLVPVGSPSNRLFTGCTGATAPSRCVS